MERIFAVMTAHGPQWDAARPLQRQPEWEAHADFMNALEAEGFVLLGGTLDDSGGGAAAADSNALLVIRAQDADEVRWRLAADPWVKGGQLSVDSVRPWTLRLGEDFETLWVPARARAKRPKRPGKPGSSLPKGRKRRRSRDEDKR